MNSRCTYLASAAGVTRPIALGRVLLLLRLDTAALMGYTGAVFERFFGSGTGILVTLLALVAWCAGPLALAHRLVRRKDF